MPHPIAPAVILAVLEVDSSAGSTSDCAWITDLKAQVGGRTGVGEGDSLGMSTADEVANPGLITRFVAGRRKEMRPSSWRPTGEPAPGSSTCTWSPTRDGRRQALASDLLDSDYREDPPYARVRPGHDLPARARLFTPVQAWLSAGRRAEVSRDFWIGDEVDLPIGLPDLHQPRFGHRKSVRGLLTAGDVLHGLLEESLGAVAAAGQPAAQWRPQLERIHELVAQAHTALRYAQGLWHPHSSVGLDEVILGHVLPALVLEHHLGQFLALPELVEGYRSPARRPLSRDRR